MTFNETEIHNYLFNSALLHSDLKYKQESLSFKEKNMV